MAYEFTAASSQYLNATSASTAAYPVTLAAFCKFNDTAVNRVILAFGRTVTPFHRQVIFRTSANRFSAQSVGSSSQEALSGVLTSVETRHICGVFTSATSREIFVNGVSAGTNSGSSTLNDLDQPAIGARNSGSFGLFWDGMIAEAGIYTAALTQPEIASLSAGMTCDKVRPQSLVFYAPLVRDLVDAKGGLTITNNNTATVANHPRVYA
jgi:hypothetical protein